MPRKVTENIPKVPAHEVAVDHAALGNIAAILVVPLREVRPERGLPAAHTLASVPITEDQVELGSDDES